MRVFPFHPRFARRPCHGSWWRRFLSSIASHLLLLVAPRLLCFSVGHPLSRVGALAFFPHCFSHSASASLFLAEPPCLSHVCKLRQYAITHQITHFIFAAIWLTRATVPLSYLGPALSCTCRCAHTPANGIRQKIKRRPQRCVRATHRNLGLASAP